MCNGIDDDCDGDVDEGLNCDCGDGVVADSEACDDGGILDGDGCSSMCSIETGFDCDGQPSVCEAVCGDGVVKGEESCDDGASSLASCCSTTCQIQPTGVECRAAADACDAPEYCDGASNGCPTDGFNDGASCDDGEFCNGLDTCNGGVCSAHAGDPCSDSSCSATCSEITDSCECDPEYCGDGIVQPERDEECDDGNSRNDDGCLESCLFPSCGDGFLNRGAEEECDDGNLSDGDGCSAMCEFECDGFVSAIGDDQRRLGLDSDVYEFDGVSGEMVTLSLSRPAGSSSGTATLVLVDDSTGETLYASDSSDLPSTITEGLPQARRYLAIVRAHTTRVGPAYRGNYCIELESTGNASQTFEETPWVE